VFEKEFHTLGSKSLMPSKQYTALLKLKKKIQKQVIQIPYYSFILFITEFSECKIDKDNI